VGAVDLESDALAKLSHDPPLPIWAAAATMVPFWKETFLRTFPILR